jgi:hypothetical protein
LVDYPDGYQVPAGRSQGRRQLLALALAMIFLISVLGTTVLSFGFDCLTTDGGDTQALILPPGGERR